jgi:CheY-like chemotaxis protein
MRILIVDDDEYGREIVEAMLVSAGTKVSLRRHRPMKPLDVWELEIVRTKLTFHLSNRRASDQRASIWH